MRIAAFLTEILRRPVQVCATIAGALAVLSLWSWASGDWRILAFGPDFVPMAPSTACSILLLSCGLVLHSQRPSKTLARATAYFAAIGISLLGLLVCVQRIGGFELPFEGWLANTTDRVANVPVGRMSPLSGMALLLAALAFLFELQPLGRRWWCRQVASVLGLAALSISIVVLASYAAGIPLLYGTHTIPMALLTALSLLPLALGLLAAAGADTLPLSLFQSGSDVGSRPSRNWVVGAPLLTFLLLSAGIGTVGYAYFRHQIVIQCQEVQNNLSAIADLKASELSAWRKDFLDDAEIFYKNSAFSALVRRCIERPQDLPRQEELRTWIGHMYATKHFDQVSLLDAACNNLMSVPDTKEPHSTLTLQKAREAMRSGQPTFADFYTDEYTKKVYFRLFVPILDVQAGGGRPLGVLRLRIDPEIYLWPYIQCWPTPSLTAETLLIRREGNEVVYLNELRHRKGTALPLRLPSEHPLDSGSSKQTLCAGCHSNPSVSPVQVAAECRLDYQGVMEGPDYRNEPVLAVVRSIPGTPWFIVAKVDQDEIYAPLREQALTTGALVLVFVVLAALGVGLMGRWRDARWLRSRLDLEREHRLILNSTDEGILGLDSDGRHVFVNPAACRMLGYAHVELIGKTSHTIWHSKKADGTPYPFQEYPILGVLKTGKSCCSDEEVFWRKDGTSFPAEFIATPSLEKDRSVAVVVLFRDITERKKLEEEQKRLVVIIEATPDIVGFADAKDRHIVYLNKAGREMCGIGNDEDVTKLNICDVHPEWTNKMFVEEILPAAVRDGKWTGECAFLNIRDRHEIPVLMVLCWHKAPNGEVEIFSTISHDITERKRAEERFKLDEARANTLLKLSQMTDRSAAEIANHALESAIKLTGSTIGYIAFVNEDETVLTMHYWSNSAMQECAIEVALVV